MITEQDSKKITDEGATVATVCKELIISAADRAFPGDGDSDGPLDEQQMGVMIMACSELYAAMLAAVLVSGKQEQKAALAMYAAGIQDSMIKLANNVGKEMK